MKLALVSLNQIWENKPANRAGCEPYIGLATRNGCELIIFPEMTLTGFSMDAKRIAEELSGSETIHWFREQAMKHGIAIIFGVVISGKAGKPTNNLVAVSPGGEILVNYQKIHLFTLSGEHEHYSKGAEPANFSLGGHRAGVSICYDLRFPELYRYLARDCSLIVTIANWPAARQEHWSALLLARAIENQVFMCGVNRTGTDGNHIEYVKSSYVIGPTGTLHDPAHSQDEMDIYLIDPGEAGTIRRAFPFFDDRDTRLYKKLL